MNLDVAKRNRLNGKFNFKMRDWQFELDGLDEHSPVPNRNGRPRKPKLIWERNRKEGHSLRVEEAEAG